MADTDLPITGKDVRIELLAGGVPVKVLDQVTNFTAKRDTTEIETKVLGTSTKYIDQEPDGWSGTLEIAESRGNVEDLISAVDAAQRARLPNSIQLVSTKFYRDGTSKTHTYVDCKLDFETSATRGSVVSTRLSWKTGLPRIG